MAAPWVTPGLKTVIKSPLEFAIRNLTKSKDFSALEISYTTSGAEQVEAWATGAKVYKVFNQTGWETMANPKFGDAKAVMFVAGDEPEGKAIALKLTAELGFDAINAGPLAEARLLEPFVNRNNLILWSSDAHLDCI